MKVVDDDLIGDLLKEASSSPRGRAHRNLHPSLGDPVQRFCMAGSPGTYFRPHRHPQSGRWELFTALRGKAAILLFDEQGTLEERLSLSAGGTASVVEIPPLTWHTLVILAEGTVLFEVKPGPYVPLEDKDFAPWSPPEGAAEARSFELRLRACQVGDGAGPGSARLAEENRP